MADDLKDILDQARRDCPDVPDHAWMKIENSIRQNYGGRPRYIAAKPKKTRLEQLAQLDADATAEQIAQKLGVTVQHARYLRRMRR